MRRKGWALLLVPIVGIGLSLASMARPPLDQYAAIERVGTRSAARERDLSLAADRKGSANVEATLLRVRKVDVGKEAPTYRSWRLRLPEPAARHFAERFLSSERGWRRSGSGSGSESGERTVSYVGDGYANEDTGDSAVLMVETRVRPTPREVAINLSVAETGQGRRSWPTLRRWCRSLFSR